MLEVTSEVSDVTNDPELVQGPDFDIAQRIRKFWMLPIRKEIY